MEILRVKKIVVACFLEAVRMTLDHLGRHRMAMAEECPPELPQLYGDFRRLRDYLQRCAGAFQDLIELDMNDDDLRLLVAASQRYVEAADARLQGALDNGTRSPDPKEREFLRKKQQLVADWAVELAIKPLSDLPLPAVATVLGEGGRALRLRLQKKLFSTSESSVMPGEMVNEFTAIEGRPAPAPEPLEPIPEPAAAEPTPAVADDGLVLDPLALHDPRLRALTGMNLRSLETALAAEDYRVASLMLCVVLETAVFDYALRHGDELTLEGDIDSWEARPILNQILGALATPNVRLAADSLLASRALLDPSRQLIAPIVVTKASVERDRQFLRSMLQRLGFLAQPEEAEPEPVIG